MSAGSGRSRNNFQSDGLKVVDVPPFDTAANACSTSAHGRQGVHVVAKHLDGHVATAAAGDQLASKM